MKTEKTITSKKSANKSNEEAIEAKAEKKAKVKKDKASKKINPEAKEKKAKEKQVIDEVVRQQNVELLEKVSTNREVKYLYPENVTGTLERKRWRQVVRNEIRKLEREMFRIHDTNTKEYKDAKKKLEEYKAKTLKKSVEIV